MTTTIQLPDTLAYQLEQRAKEQHRSVEDVALGILHAALDTIGLPMSIDDVTARIKATPPNTQNIRPAQGSLVDALQNAPVDPAFDLAQWNEGWASVEGELQAMSRTDSVDDRNEQ